MTEFPRQFYAFGPFRLDVVKRRLLHNDVPVTLPSKAFEMLLALIEQRGRVLDKEELLRRVWPDQIVEEANLTVNMSALRKALGERASEHQYILTIPGRGYRFVAEVREVQDTRAEPILEHHAGSREIARHEGTGAQESIKDENPAGGQVIQAGDEARALDAHSAALAHHDIKGQVVTPITADRPTSNKRYRTRAVVVTLMCAAVLAATALGLYYFFSGKTPIAAFQAMRITRLTTNGRAVDASISPDGRYLVYAMRDDGGQSLWLKQISAESNVQITPPADVTYAGLTFSRDGESIYYILYGKKHPSGALYQIHLLGGAQKKLMDHLNSPVTFSPDGRQLAFVRIHPDQGEITLMLANADGTGVRKLAVRKLLDGFSQGGPAWSPDGKVIACGAGGASGGYYVNVVEVRVADGATRLITSHKWADVNRLAWLNDGSGLVLSAVDQGSWELPQLWYLSYPGGEVTRITNDLNKYAQSSLSLTADSSALVTLQSQLITNIWVVPDGDAGRARQVTFGSIGKYDGLYGLSWTPDGRIVYGAFSGDSQVFWVMNADGTGQKQLTPEGYVESLPNVTLDGRYIVFHSNRTGQFEIWRLDIDGGNLRQLTLSGDNFQPHCSPESQWVVYRSSSDGIGTLWKVTIEGGEPIRLTDKPSSWPVVSPDGKLIACSYFDEQLSPNYQLAVIPFDGGRPLKTFDLPATATLWNSLRWAPDGSALDYRDTRHGVWRQPLAGGAPEKLPAFGTELIHNFSWSRDGKQLAFARGTAVNDIILIRNFK